MWECKAIDHGITIFPNGKIGPCCQIDMSYLKDASVMHDPNRFADLKTETPPPACEKCSYAESVGMDGYRNVFKNKFDSSIGGVQFLDIRNTNLCNLKCRYCSDTFSDKWGKELGHAEPLIQTDISDIYTFATADLRDLYFTGGEPFMNPDHWKFLQHIVDQGYAHKIELRYNTNVTLTKYKTLDIADLWSHFRCVNVQCSIDAVGPVNNFIRSGSDWDAISQNIEKLRGMSNVSIELSPVVSILNIWFLPELYKFAEDRNILVSPIMLYNPEVLSVAVIPDSLKTQALSIVEQLIPFKTNDPKVHQSFITQLKSQIENNYNTHLFPHTVAHISALDNLRGESLFNYMPFENPIIDRILSENDSKQ